MKLYILRLFIITVTNPYVLRYVNKREANGSQINANPRAFEMSVFYIKVLDKGTIKQLKIQGPTYDKTPPLEIMGRVFAYMGKLR